MLVKSKEAHKVKISPPRLKDWHKRQLEENWRNLHKWSLEFQDWQIWSRKENFEEMSRQDLRGLGIDNNKFGLHIWSLARKVPEIYRSYIFGPYELLIFKPKTILNINTTGTLNYKPKQSNPKPTTPLAQNHNKPTPFYNPIHPIP